MLGRVAGWARPVSDKLGPEAGWAALTAWPAGGLLVGLGLSLVSDTSDRPGQQEVMLFMTEMDPSTKPKRPQNFGWEGVGGGEKLWRRDLSLAPLGPRRIYSGIRRFISKFPTYRTSKLFINPASGYHCTRARTSDSTVDGRNPSCTA